MVVSIGNCLRIVRHPRTLIAAAHNNKREDYYKIECFHKTMDQSAHFCLWNTCPNEGPLGTYSGSEPLYLFTQSLATCNRSPIGIRPTIKWPVSMAIQRRITLLALAKDPAEASPNRVSRAELELRRPTSTLPAYRRRRRLSFGIIVSQSAVSRQGTATTRRLGDSCESPQVVE